jgi:hypothetical protein
MTKKEMKRLALLKWQYIVDNDGFSSGLTERYPELEKLMNKCSYCSMYINRITDCRGCPLKQGKFTCFDDEHLFSNWDWCRSKQNAQKVLDLIKSIPDED